MLFHADLTLISFDLNVVAPDIILQVVLHVNTALIASRSDVDMDECQCLSSPFETVWDEHLTACLYVVGDRSSSPLPDFVPNTHPEELSYPPAAVPAANAGPSKTLKRRVTPSAVSRLSTPPETLENEDIPPPPRKVCGSFVRIFFFWCLILVFPTLPTSAAIEEASTCTTAIYNRHRRSLGH